MHYAVGLPYRSNFRPDENITTAYETFLAAVDTPHALTAQYACAEYTKSFTDAHPLADELAQGKDALALGADSGNDEYNQAVIRVPKIEALIGQGTVPTDLPAYFVSESLADETTADLDVQPNPAPSLPGSNDAGLGGIFGIIAAIIGALGLLAGLIPNLSQFLNFGR